MKQSVLFLIVIVACCLSCRNGANSSSNILAQASKPDVTEVLYFHGKQRCITCNTIERLTKEVVDSLANNQVVMKVIDISQPENKAIVDQYEVTWSSLIVQRNGKVENLTKMGFSCAKREPDLFKERLTEAIRQIAQ